MEEPKESVCACGEDAGKGGEQGGVRNQKTCMRGLEARRAKDQWGKNVQSEVVGERGSGFWGLAPPTEGLQGLGWGLGVSRTQSPGRGTAGQGSGELTSKT